MGKDCFRRATNTALSNGGWGASGRFGSLAAKIRLHEGILFIPFFLCPLSFQATKEAKFHKNDSVHI
jgi:hypothetical protein